MRVGRPAGAGRNKAHAIKSETGPSTRGMQSPGPLGPAFTIAEPVSGRNVSSIGAPSYRGRLLKLVPSSPSRTPAAA